MTDLSLDIASLQAHAAHDALALGGMLDYTGGAIRITDDYRKTALARAVPFSYFEGGAWWLPPDPDPESARFACTLFPTLGGEYPELLARAAMSTVDHTPIDLATARWTDRPTEQDPWQRVLANVRADGKEPHLFQRIDVDYAIDRMNQGKGAYLGWEMGLGKTIGTCMLIDGWPANFVFICCPNNAKQDPWAESLALYCPWLEVVVVGNTKDERDAAEQRMLKLSKSDTPFACICHPAAMNLIAERTKARTGWDRLGQWDLKVFDESHLVKNGSAKFVRTFRRLKSAGALLLSGSVMSGAAEDLFHPYRIMRPKRYTRQWEDWNDRFLEVVQGDYGQVVVGPSLSRLGEFKRELGECLVVRKAADYLSLPEPRRIDHDATLHRQQKAAYIELANELLAEMPDGSLVSTIEGAGLVTKLRAITGGVPSGKSGLISGKCDDVVEAVLAGGDAQWVLFAWHKRLVRELHRRLREAGLPAGVIDGDVPKPRREREVELFKHQGFKVLVASISTMSASVNLQNASQVGLVEESYDPTDNTQAIARVLRQGQTQNVVVHTWRCPDTVDTLNVLPTHLTKSALRTLVLGS